MVGISACFLIFLYVRFELSYDVFHKNADRICRVVTDVKTPSQVFNWYQTSAPMAAAIKADIPQVEATTRTIPANVLVIKNNISFQEEKALWADASLFSIFDLPLKYGNPKTALIAPNSIVFSESEAKKYFGDINPVGQTLLLSGNKLPSIVTAVMKDIPENSQVKAEMLISMSTFVKAFNPTIESDWSSFLYSTYLLLSPGTKPETIQKRLPGIIEKYAGAEMKRENQTFTLFLEPLKSVYLQSGRGPISGDINNIYIFSIVAAFLLLIACVNFVNLTTARSVERAKEVGIRKVAGALRVQLMMQFLIESVIISFCAFLLAVLLSQILLPLFNQLAGKIISKSIFEHGLFVLLLFLLSIAVGFFAGAYPAFALSSFKPVSVLKGRYASGSKAVLLRKTLVIAQFSISIALIIGVLVIYTQLNFMRKQPLGFNKEQTIIIDHHGDANAPAFKQQLSEISSVKSASISSSIPGKDYSNNMVWQATIENEKGEMQKMNLNAYIVDYDFVHVYQLKLIAGRAFSTQYPTDSLHALILNKTAVTALGYPFPEKIIGKRFVQEGIQGTVIGVVEDFHFRSLKETVQPLSLETGIGANRFITLKIDSRNLSETLRAIKTRWARTITDRPFNYIFLDESFNQLYRSEDRFGNLFFCFATLAILVSCMGLLALAAYSTSQRTKEIGIRKILGASVAGIAGLLSKDFLKQVIVAFLIASPVAWYFMNKWLDGFAYRISISWWIFAVTGLSALFIALMTVSFHAIKAAIANPVKSLRAE